MEATPSSGGSRLTDELLAACRRAFPGRDQLQVARRERISDGWECDVYAFTVTGTEAGEPRRDELILRLYQGEQAAQKAASEFAAMSKLRGAGYPVPRVDFLATEPDALGKPFIIMEKIAGEPLWRLIRQATGERRQELLGLFCGLLVKLHALDWRPFARDSVSFPAGSIDRWICWAQGILHSLGATDFDEALAWLSHQGRRIHSPTLAVVHQDFHPNNVLVRVDGAPFVIDWTLVNVADPRLDLGWTLVLMREWEGSSMRELILEEYQRLTGRPIADVEVFEVAAAVRRLASIVISLRVGADKLGMRPGAEANMTAQRSSLLTSYAILREHTDLRIPAVEGLLATTAPVSPSPPHSS